MANSIALATTYVPLLDEVYKNASLTAERTGGILTQKRAYSVCKGYCDYKRW